MSENKVKFGMGIKIWSAFCIISSVLTIAINMIAGGYVLAVMGILGVAAYIWLLIGKQKMAFYLIACVSVGVMVCNLALYKVNIFSSLLGLVNPVITYVLISKNWGEMH